MTGDGGTTPLCYYDRSSGITITDGGDAGAWWGFWVRDGDDDGEEHMYHIQGPFIIVSGAASTDESQEVWQAVVSALAAWHWEVK